MRALASDAPRSVTVVRFVRAALLVALSLAYAPAARAETGYDLWLRYRPIEEAAVREQYRKTVSNLVLPQASPTGRVIAAEVKRGLRGLLGGDVPLSEALQRDGALVIGTPANSSVIAALGWSSALARQGREGYLIRSTHVGRYEATVIASEGETGALYGAFHFLRLLQARQPVVHLDIAERPRLELRLLNHWDNLDGSIERGYAGKSLWLWNELPGRVDPRVEDYARANASIGINGSVINSVNADPKMLTSAYLQGAAALADVLRPYGIRVFLSVNLASPRMMGALPTADPLDPAVARWWKGKAAEIYRVIPDFGGFLVKANSEGQPGPQDYGRSHAEGANVLADALASHGGVVMWRAFVYDPDVDPDRVKRAYKEFVPLDGTFRENVFVQVKNGPLDFQPREPFHPLFGAMPKTPLLAELQITQEYFGHSTHLVYLPPMWNEFLRSETYTNGPGSPVSGIVDGTIERSRRTGIAGVANTGRDQNWTGHDMAQANWYAFGRLAWSLDLSPQTIADEWIPMTWGPAPDVVAAIRTILLDSYETYVNYTMPLGLHHLIGGDHYEPMPENADAPRADWSAVYYHRADAHGIGFDRTRHGSGAVDQYHAPLRDLFNDPATTPESLLLWFHHLPWDYTLRSGTTLWERLVAHYNNGAEQAASLERQWATLRGRVDPERFAAVAVRMRQQAEDAAAWRDKCLRYFQHRKSGSG
jgi:alpha-glucuronidase